MQTVGLIGTGHWGPNIAKSLELSELATLKWLCDSNPEHLELIAPKYPRTQTTLDAEAVIDDAEVDAVVISTPVMSHYQLAQQALNAGKHVLVEKPLTFTSAEALELVQLAAEKNKLLMVGHIFEYNASIQALKNFITSGELGEIYYLHFERTNLGPVRTDVNAFWDLGSHDVYIMSYLLDCYPEKVTAFGRTVLNKDIEDVAFATFSFADGPIAHVYASWLNPRKVRQIVVVGSYKMAIWDDLDLRSPIRIYDKRVETPPIGEINTFLAHKTVPTDGGMFVPKIKINQPLLAECEHFLKCIQNGTPIQTDGYSGFQVVKTLEAVTQSIRNDSATIPIQIPTIKEAGIF